MSDEYINIDNHYDWDDIQTQNYNMLNFKLQLTVLELNNLSNYPSVINGLIHSYYYDQDIANIINNITFKQRNILIKGNCPSFGHIYCDCYCTPWKMKIYFVSNINGIPNINGKPDVVLILYDPYILFIRYGTNCAYNRHSMTIFEMIIHFTCLIHTHMWDLSIVKIKKNTNCDKCVVETNKSDCDKCIVETFKSEKNILELLNVVNVAVTNFYNNKN